MSDTIESMQIGDGLFIRVVPIVDLREQDVNAQQMQPRHFERLKENIRARGQIESLPYCHRPDDEGPYHIISGHHRAKAARAAGLTEIPVIVDVKPMSRSEVIARQIAHNELHGNPDAEILAQLIAEIDNVDDLLMTGLDEDLLPTLSDEKDTPLGLPSADLDWRLVAMTFLPNQLESFRDALALIDSSTDIVGVAHVDQFEAFAQASLQYGRRHEIKSISTIVAHLTDLARAEVLAMRDEPDSVPMSTVLPRVHRDTAKALDERLNEIMEKCGLDREKALVALIEGATESPE